MSSSELNYTYFQNKITYMPPWCNFKTWFKAGSLICHLGIILWPHLKQGHLYVCHLGVIVRPYLEQGHLGAAQGKQGQLGWYLESPKCKLRWFRWVKSIPRPFWEKGFSKWTPLVSIHRQKQTESDEYISKPWFYYWCYRVLQTGVPPLWHYDTLYNTM